MSTRPILFAYDGSDCAKAAIEQAAEQLQNGRPAIVLTVWQPYGGGFVSAGGIAPAGLEEAVQSEASRVAEEGARRARKAGFDAVSLTETADSIWNRIAESADEHDASIVVLGSHGRTGLSHLLIGSVAERVASHTDRPVLIAHRSEAAIKR
jgi:nucleotide-binding universal stress UspA family protein